MSLVRTIGGQPEPLDLSDLSALARADRAEIALAVLNEAFATDPEAARSRRAVIQDIVGERPRAERVPHGRRLAEAWQDLERAGAVCEDVEETRHGWWFCTGWGKWLLEDSPAPGDELRRRLDG